MYITTFTVRGYGAFPIDMLRYDSCFPWSPRDAEAISNKEYLRSVELATRHQLKGDERIVTKERWASFQWPGISITPARKY